MSGWHAACLGGPAMFDIRSPCALFAIALLAGCAPNSAAGPSATTAPRHPNAAPLPAERASIGALRASVETRVGHPVKLTIEERVQAITDAEIRALLGDDAARSAAIVVLDAKTGAVRALSGGRRSGKTVEDVPDLAARVALTTGSTFKSFTVAAAVDAGVVTPETKIDAENGAWECAPGRIVKDAVPHGEITVADLLAYSSNIAAVKVFRMVGRDRWAKAMRGLGFGALELPLEVANAPFAVDAWEDREVEGTAFGHGALVPPLSIAAAFTAIADDGVVHRPVLVEGAASKSERVFSAEAARTVRTMLEGVVARDDGTGTRARVPGLRVAGKTGTADLDDGSQWASFVGTFPAEAPTHVVFVGVATTGKGYGGGTVAAPAFARVVKALRA